MRYKCNKDKSRQESRWWLINEETVEEIRHQLIVSISLLDHGYQPMPGRLRRALHWLDSGLHNSLPKEDYYQAQQGYGCNKPLQSWKFDSATGFWRLEKVLNREDWKPEFLFNFPVHQVDLIDLGDQVDLGDLKDLPDNDIYIVPGK